MTTAKWTSMQDARYAAPRFNEKGCLQVCVGGGGEMLLITYWTS
jgi:hypothetical protein